MSDRKVTRAIENGNFLGRERNKIGEIEEKHFDAVVKKMARKSTQRMEYDTGKVSAHYLLGPHFPPSRSEERRTFVLKPTI